MTTGRILGLCRRDVSGRLCPSSISYYNNRETKKERKKEGRGKGKDEERKKERTGRDRLNETNKRKTKTRLK